MPVTEIQTVFLSGLVKADAPDGPGYSAPQGPDSGRVAEVQIAIDHKRAGRCQFRICGRSKGSQRNAGRRYGQKSFVQLIDPF